MVDLFKVMESQNIDVHSIKLKEIIEKFNIKGKIKIGGSSLSRIEWLDEDMKLYLEMIE